MEDPWVGVVHGHDFDVGLKMKGWQNTSNGLPPGVMPWPVHPQRLAAIASDFEHPPALVECIPCVTDIDREWRRPVKPMKKKWKKEPIDILFQPIPTTGKATLACTPNR